MSFSIQDNYSVLNNYAYHQKSSFYTTIDFLSAPIRNVLGGRNVYVIPQTYTDPFSTVGKIAALFFSVVLFPIAIVSSGAFVIKIATLPWLWQKKEVEAQSIDAWNRLNPLLAIAGKIENHSATSDDVNRVIELVKERPEVCLRKDVDVAFFRAINIKINDNCPWEKITIALKLLNARDATELINHAVQTKLEKEFKEQYHLTSANEILTLVLSSLRDSEDIADCLDKLLKNALKINFSNSKFFNFIKLDIADSLITSYFTYKKASANRNDEILYYNQIEKFYRSSVSPLFDKPFENLEASKVLSEMLSSQIRMQEIKNEFSRDTQFMQSRRTMA